MEGGLVKEIVEALILAAVASWYIETHESQRHMKEGYDWATYNALRPLNQMWFEERRATWPENAWRAPPERPLWADREKADRAFQERNSQAIRTFGR